MSKREFTTEYLLYGLLFLLAASVRFIHLGQMALNNFEALQAMQAFNISSGANVLMGDQPAYVILTAGLFKLFSSGNFAARFWPALIGSCAVFLPLLFRKAFGQRLALLLGLFLAIDPALVAISRTAGVESLAIVFGIGAAGFLVNKKMILAGVCLGIAIASGPAFWMGMVIFLLVYLSASLFMHVYIFEGLEAKDFEVFGAGAIITMALLGTGFMAVPNGITGISNGLLSFIHNWGSQSLVPLSSSLIVFGLTYFPLIILAVMGLINSFNRRRELVSVMGIWFIAALFLMIVNPSREIWDWVWAALPLWGLTALGVDGLVYEISDDVRLALIVEIVLSVVLVVFSYLNILAYFNNPSSDLIVQNNRLIAAALPIALVLLLTVFMAWGWSPRSAFRGLGIGVGILLFGWMAAGAMKNAGGMQQISGYAWKPQSITIGEQLVVSQINDLSIWNHGLPQNIDIDVVGFDVPAMRWALRDFSQVTYDTQFPQTATPSIIIAPDYLQIGATTLYRGQGLAWEQYPAFAQMGLSDWLKWSFYREAPVEEIRLIVWARNDLFK